MSRKIELAQNILAEVLNYMLAVSLEILLFGDILKQWPGDLKIACLVLVPVFYYLVREYCRHVPLFFLLHILPAVGVCKWYGVNMAEKVVFGILAIVFALFSVGRRLSGSRSKAKAIFPLTAAGLFLAVYLADSLQAGGICGSDLTHLMILYMLAYFLYFYLTQFLGYVDMNNRTTEHVPVNRAFYTSFGLVAAFLAFFAVVISLLADRQLADSIAGKIGSLLRAVIAFLTSLFPSRDIKAEDMILESNNAPDAAMDFFPVQETETSLLAQILNVLAAIFAVVVLAVLLAVMITGFIRLVKSAFLEKRQERMAETKENDKIEFLARPKGKRKVKDRESFPVLARTPSQAVRQQYFRTICRKVRILREEQTEKLILSGTARECCEALFPEKQKEAADFAVLYEKARYGESACDREDVKKMRRLAALLLK